MIKIVGLGPGAPEALTYGAIKALEDSDNLFFRTEKHPTVDYLKEKLNGFNTCDNYYETSDSFDEVYEKIAKDLDKEIRKYEKEERKEQKEFAHELKKQMEKETE